MRPVPGWCAEGGVARFVAGWWGGRARARVGLGVEVLCDGVRGALEGCGACAESGLPDECA